MKRWLLMLVGALGLMTTILTGQSPAPIPSSERSGGAGKRAKNHQLMVPKILKEGAPARMANFTRKVRINSSLALTISSSPSGILIHPKALTMAPGEKTLRFPVRVADNRKVDLDRNVVMTIQAAGYTERAQLTLKDDEPAPKMNFESQSSTRLLEGGKAQRWSVTLDKPAPKDFTINLSSNPAGEVWFTPYLNFKPGDTRVDFKVYPEDDSLIDGNQSVTITASSKSGIKSIQKTILIADDEERKLRFYFQQKEIAEGEVAEGYVSVDNDVVSNLRVDLSTSDSSALKIPSSIIIPAGKSDASFSIIALKDANNKADRTVNIIASAATFQTGQFSMQVMDRTLMDFQFVDLPLTAKSGSSFTTQIRAVTQSGFLLRTMSGPLELELLLADGTVLPLGTSASADPFWNVEIMTPANVSGMVRIRAKHASGFSTESPLFKLNGADALDSYAKLNLSTNDIIWDPIHELIYASVAISPIGEHSGHVVAINPETREIVHSIKMGILGQLALTSDSSRLYIAENSPARISRIDLPAFTVGPDFPVGGSDLGNRVRIEDICTVKDQPDLLLVSITSGEFSNHHEGVSVYKDGIEMPSKTPSRGSWNRIEPSADPALFFNLNNDSLKTELSRLRLVETGLVQEGTTEIEDRVPGDIRADGDLLIESSGWVFEGATMRKLGDIPDQKAFCPDLATQRLYALDQNQITIHDSGHLSAIHFYNLPGEVESPSHLIRWGESGLAFRTPTEIHLIHERNLVPQGAPANLSVSVASTKSLIPIGQPFQYTIRVRNSGPNPALGSVITVTLSSYQTGLGAPISSTGKFRQLSADSFQMAAGNIAAGSEVMLTIPARLPDLAFNSCIAFASSEVPDSDTSNNTAFKLMSAKMDLKPDVFTSFGIGDHSLIHDSNREVLWTATSATWRGVFGGSVISIDPLNGQISDPIEIGGTPMENLMALSRNGRYLYVGLQDVPEIACVDLLATPKTVTRILLPKSVYGRDNFAKDIVTLEGDGRSILVVGSDDQAVSVFDGLVQRPLKIPLVQTDDIAHSGTPGIYIGCKTLEQGFDLSKFQISSSGVSEILHMNHDNGYEGFNVIYTIVTDRGLILTNKGNLIDANTLFPVRNLDAQGTPCLDVANQRAYLSIGEKLHCFDLKTGKEIGSLNIPWAEEYELHDQCIRWGTDGLAIRLHGRFHLVRWSKAVGAIPTSPVLAKAAAPVPSSTTEDTDEDGIADVLEWLFGTSAEHPDSHPITLGDLPDSTDPTLHILFPRRAEVSATAYTIETSSDLQEWTEAQDVVETVAEAETINGVLIEKVSAAIPVSESSSLYVRIRWNP